MGGGPAACALVELAPLLCHAALPAGTLSFIPKKVMLLILGWSRSLETIFSQLSYACQLVYQVSSMVAQTFVQ
jgi:hypothetical protein